MRVNKFYLVEYCTPLPSAPFRYTAHRIHNTKYACSANDLIASIKKIIIIIIIIVIYLVRACVYVCGAAPARVLMYNKYKCSMYIIKQDLYLRPRLLCSAGVVQKIFACT